eukprot:9470819-Ditylum_brightwellii.AAC.1
MEDRINEATFNKEEENEATEMVKVLSDTKVLIQEAIDHLYVAYNLYNKYGHYKARASSALNKKFPLRSTSIEHGDICRGLAGQGSPRMCMDKDCKINSHAKAEKDLK